MDVAREHHADSSARRRRERRLRAWFRHEQFAIRCALASAKHHSHMRVGSVATQTDDEVLAATYAATASPAATCSDPCSVTGDGTRGSSTCCQSCCAGSSVRVRGTRTCDVIHRTSTCSDNTTATVATDVNLDITGLFSSTAVEAFAPQVIVSLPPFEEFTAPVYNQVHQEQIVAAEMTLNIVENSAVQEQVIVQEIPQVPIVERIQEQIVDITGLANQQFSITGVEVSAPQAVGSLSPFQEFDAPLYNQIHQEQIVAGETTQNTFENPAVQEHVIFQEIPQAPQVVDSFPLLEGVAAREYNQVHQEQIGATPQAQVIVQEIPEILVVERIQERIMETGVNRDTTGLVVQEIPEVFFLLDRRPRNKLWRPSR